MMKRPTSNKTIITIFKNTDKDEFSVADYQLNDSDILIYDKLSSKPKADFLAGRISIWESITQYFLSQNTAFDVSEMKVSYDVLGRPVINEEDGVTISISHSHAWGAGIISSHNDIGIDIEKIKKRDYAIIDYVLSNNERELFESDLSDKIITVLWTMKEAIMKANGRGLLNPHLIALDNFILYDDEYVASFVDQDKKLWQTITILIDDFVVSVAYLKENHESIILSWNIKIGLQTSKKLPVS